MKQQRPINLNLFTIRFPIPAIISILHRISGLLLFLFIPILLWVLSFSLTETGFGTLQEWFNSGSIKVICWLVFAPFCFHLVAGIRHLLMDVELGVTLKAGRGSAKLAFIISILLIILAGVWLW